MMSERSRRGFSTNVGLFILYTAALLTLVMALFPPYASLNGTEYAFVLTGPAWARNVGTLGEELGLTAGIHWPLLLLQVGTVWAIALSAIFFVRRRSPSLMVSVPLLIAVSIHTIQEVFS